MGPAKSPKNHQHCSPTHHQNCQRSSQTLDAFKNEAKRFLRAYPTLLELSRDARTANRSQLPQLLKGGAVYEIRLNVAAEKEYEPSYAEPEEEEDPNKYPSKTRIKINENLNRR